MKKSKNRAKKPIKVLFYEPYPMGLGGNFQTQLYILQMLDRSKLIPIVVAPIQGIALDEFRKIGVECFVISPSGRLASYGGKILRSGIFRRVQMGLNLLRYNLKLLKFIKKQGVDIIYANCVRAEMSIGFAGLLTGTPSLMYIKGELDNPFIDRVSFILSSKILFFSEQNKLDKYKKWVSFFEKKIEILPIGIDLKSIEKILLGNKNNILEELKIRSETINVIVLAQLYPPKGQHFVLEALEQVVKKFPKVHVYFLGDHVVEEYRYYKLELEQFILERGLINNVTFTGWRRDALDVVTVMDILIHPSLAEGFGRAVLESMALGKPVIASSVGGLREAIKDGENGFLVQPGNIKMIEKRWKQLIENKSLRKKLGENARKTVLDGYSIDDKVEKLSKIWIEMDRKKYN